MHAANPADNAESTREPKKWRRTHSYTEDSPAQPRLTPFGPSLAGALSQHSPWLAEKPVLLSAIAGVFQLQTLETPQNAYQVAVLGRFQQWPSLSALKI